MFRWWADGEHPSDCLCKQECYLTGYFVPAEELCRLYHFQGEKTMSMIADVPVKDLVKTYGTPLVVYDAGALRSRLKEFTENFQSDRFNTGILYASKAFSCKAVLKLANEYGLYVDAVSCGEIHTALAAGYDPAKIVFHGNNKTADDLQYALTKGVGTIVVDNLMEAQLLDQMIRGTDHTIHTLVRVNPGISAHTHHYIVTGHVDSKFGISLLNESELVDTIRILKDNPNISFDGFHSHIGSQIFEKQAFVEEIRKLFETAADFREKYGISCNTMDFGGGFAAVYTEEDHPIPIKEVCDTILSTCTEEEDRLHTGIQKVLIEPGRSIVAEAGYNLYTVGFLKKTPNRSYVFVDGGMSDNIRPALYQAKYDAYIDGKETEPVKETMTVAGKCCESGDILIEAIDLPEVKSGDILVMKTCGAYGYAMASHYNKLPLPAVVFAEDGNHRTVIRRETFEHMIALEED